jgi:hypothetical protein
MEADSVEDYTDKITGWTIKGLNPGTSEKIILYETSKPAMKTRGKKRQERDFNH